MHSYTGQHKPWEILNRLGHYISYKITCEIETAQAVKAQLLASQSTALPIVPLSKMNRVLTVFWVDNFDIKVEREKAKNSKNTTNIVAFQEESDLTYVHHEQITVHKRRKLIPRDDDNLAKDFVNPKVEPRCILSNVMIDARDPSLLIARYYFWTWLRANNAIDQAILPLTAWLLQFRNKESIKMTVTTYLPPLDSKVTEFKTIVTYMKYLQILADDVNMPYVRKYLVRLWSCCKRLQNQMEPTRNIPKH